MAIAEFHEVVDADRNRLFQAVTRYEDYPLFVDGVKKIEVERMEKGRAKVTYHVSMMKDVIYTIDIRENEQTGIVEWSLIQSDSFKKNNGRWEIKAAGAGKADVRYSLEIEFSFPVPGLILNRLVKGSLPSMVKSFVKKANNG